jgi:hypothetical protein
MRFVLSMDYNVAISCQNCIFDNMEGGGWGVAFDISTKQMIIENCTFSNSHSTERGVFYRIERMYFYFI